MKERILCSACLSFLMIQALIVLITGGQPYKEVPASSIFYNMEKSKEILLQGQVYKKADTSKNQVLYLKNNSIIYKNKSFKESNIIVYLDTFEDISIGETVCIRGQLNIFEQARNPGNFDQKLYYAKQNIYGSVWCEEIVSISGDESRLKETLYQLKQAWKKIIMENMSEDTGGVLSAMLLSEKSEMDTETKEIYQKIGIGHILAISGLHISFIGLGIYKVFRKTGVPYLVSGVLSAAVLTGYVLMVGFSVSVIRAYIMLLFRILADVTGRVYDILTALAFSAAVTVACQPLYMMDAGFYMSYGSILGIVLVNPQLEKLLPQKNKLMRESMSSFAINVTLFPVMLWFYYEFPTYSFVMNLIVIPLMSLVLGMGIFGSFGIILFEPLGKLCFSIVDLILQFYKFLGNSGSRLPLATIVFGKPDFYKIVLYYILLSLLLVFLKLCKNEKILKRSKKYILGCLALLMVIPIRFPDGKLQVTFIDVGQGDSIFIRGPYRNTYLIDGGSSDVEKVGQYRIESFLKAQGVGTLDYVFISHGDADHYNGILEMIERQTTGVKIKSMVLPTNYQKDEKLLELLEAALNQGIKVSVIEKGQKIEEGRLEITCLQPGVGDENLEGNAGSMVLDVSFEKFDMLCTGDVENEGEEMLNVNLGDKRYDVLKVAHHGSKNSTKEKFLEIVKPYISIISAGINNSYGHPHKETLERLLDFGSVIYQTNENGAITIESDGDFIDIFSGYI